MTKITFGVAASAFAAIRSLQQTALDFGDEFPLAKSYIFNSFYVDDCLAGADNVEQAFLLQQQLQRLLEKGGFYFVNGVLILLMCWILFHRS